jgi:hypothetical protein
MIFVRDKGRMCNNLLQYGHLYAWGREHGRPTVSLRFAYKYQFFHICHTPYHNFFTYLCIKYAAKLQLIPTVRFDEEDADTSSQEAEMMRYRTVLAEGWYVRFPELFIKYKDEIKLLFAFLPAITGKVEKALSVYNKQSLFLGVHIRRGDYATWQNGKYLFSDMQYLSVIKQFVELHNEENIEVFICGNDPKLDRQVYYDALGENRVHFPQGNPGEDICLLSHCDYLIGAPSTFTLVSAMYNNTPLYWIKDVNAPLTESSFGYFDNLFRHII